MRKPVRKTNAAHTSDIHQLKSGAPLVKWTVAAITPAPAGMGIPTKYFRPGRPGLEGCGLFWMLKRARRLAPAMRKAKLATAPNCTTRESASVPASEPRVRNPHIQARSEGATPKV